MVVALGIGTLWLLYTSMVGLNVSSTHTISATPPLVLCTIFPPFYSTFCPNQRALVFFKFPNLRDPSLTLSSHSPSSPLVSVATFAVDALLLFSLLFSHCICQRPAALLCYVTLCCYVTSRCALSFYGNIVKSSGVRHRICIPVFSKSSNLQTDVLLSTPEKPYLSLLKIYLNNCA